jgi:hypothetical protein
VILLLIPLAGIVLGVVLWGVLRGMGVLNVLGIEGRVAAPSRERREPSNLRERVEDIPQGCLIAVIAVTALWTVGWLVVLLIGLSVLS